MHAKFFERYGIIFKRALVELGGDIGTITIFLQNTEDYDKVIPKSVVIGIRDDVYYQNLVSLNGMETKRRKDIRSLQHLNLEQIQKLDINPELNSQERYNLVSLLVQYGDCFAWDYISLGKCNLEPFTIDVGDNRPVYNPP